MRQGSWHGYPKVWNLGHPNVARLLEGQVLVEEKIDGSQWSFGSFGGELKLKTHHKERAYPVDEKMFSGAADEVYSMFKAGMLTDGYTYRSEVISRPKHNAMLYERTPEKFMVLFDVETDYCKFMSPAERNLEGDRLGLETPRSWYLGPGSLFRLDSLEQMLEGTPMLGGAMIEGVVIKNYGQFGADGKVLMGKHVCEKFREINNKAQRAANPTQADIISSLGDRYRSEQRWEKAIQHLRESGGLVGGPEDIGSLICEVPEDVKAECREEISEALFTWAWPRLKRTLTKGLPEWYKQKLLERQFSAEGVQEP